MSAARHVVLLHPSLAFTGDTERVLAIARVLRSSGARATVVTRPGSRAHAFEAHARQAGFELRYCELTAHPWQAPFAFLRTRRVLDELDPDLLHVVSESLAPFAAAIAPALGVPYVLEIHREPDAPMPRRAALVAVALSSPTLAAEAVNRGRIPKRLLHVVRHAPDWGAAESAGPRPDQEGTLRVGCSGELDGDHGTETFIEAVRLLGPLPRPCHFAILGEGAREEELRRRVREAGLAERITFGVPTTVDAAQTLAALDIHVSARVRGGPGWLTQLALALGVPSIVSAVGDSFAMVEDGESGVLFERGEARKLAEALEALITDTENARRLGARARERMRALRPPGAFAAELDDLHAAALEAAQV